MMASPLSSRLKARSLSLPPFAVAAVIGAASITYFATRRPIHCDAKTMAGQESTKTFSFPKTMLFAKQLTVSEVEQVNHDTKRITFTLPGGSHELSGVPGGGAVLTQHTPAGRFFPVLRPYTPISVEDEQGRIQLLVKKYPNGVASTYMHSLTPGQTLTVRGPIPTYYAWAPSNTARDVLFIAGGAGITPIYSLTNSILKNPEDKTRIDLVWGVNGVRDIVLKDELEALQKQHPDRLRVTYCVSGSGDTQLDATYKKGYITQTVLQEVVKRYETGKWGDVKGKKVFLCGPPVMEDAIAGTSGILQGLGVDKRSIHRF